MTRTLSPKEIEQLSAYLDGQVSGAERLKLEARLAQDTDLNQTLSDLRQTRALLRALPRLRAPRNYTLTPAAAAQIRPAQRRPFWQQAPAWGWASALATLLLAVFVLGDFMGWFRPPLPQAAAAEVATLAFEATADTQATQLRQTEPESAAGLEESSQPAAGEGMGGSGGGQGGGAEGPGDPFPPTPTLSYLEPQLDHRTTLTPTPEISETYKVNPPEVSVLSTETPLQSPLPDVTPTTLDASPGWLRWLQGLLLLAALGAGIIAWQLRRPGQGA